MKYIFIFLVVVSSEIFRVSDADYCYRDATCYTRSARTVYSYYSCGWWGKRCARASTVYYTTSKKCTEEICCEGYGGSNCSIELCDKPCKNGGECIDDACSCPDGFTPPDCDPICTTPCKNGGECIGPDECNCLAGFLAPYCDEDIDCGTHTPIDNGGVNYTTTTSGSTVTYFCDTHYNLTDGNTTRTCQTNYGWSGQRPRCAYTNYCATSKPCLNEAVCTDVLDDYLCTCLAGWSGKHCDEDVQPPVLSGCLSNLSVNATNTTKYFEWTEPTFNDPFGNDLVITKNYQTPHYDFPWGDYTVQYVATKPSNGLSTECVFTIKVRPTPCNELNIPTSGSRICNGWKTDYGKFCLVACNRDYMIDPAHKFGILYVCGASGAWSAGASVPDCDVPVVDDEFMTLNPEFRKYSYDNNCTDTVTTKYLQEVYLDRMCGASGEFNDFCQTYPEGDFPENVEVDCS